MASRRDSPYTREAATAWLAEVDANSYYFVTNRHVAKTFDSLSAIALWRPNIDTQKFVASDYTRISYSSGVDLAVIRCRLYNPPNQALEVLKWKDNALLMKGEKVLVVGFPGEFFSPDSDLKTSTMGSIMTISESTAPRNDFGVTGGNSEAVGLINNGSSGSPVILMFKGEPTVVGIAYGTGQHYNHPNNQTDVLLNWLSVKSLINEIKSK